MFIYVAAEGLLLITQCYPTMQQNWTRRPPGRWADGDQYLRILSPQIIDISIFNTSLCDTCRDVSECFPSLCVFRQTTSGSLQTVYPFILVVFDGLLRTEHQSPFTSNILQVNPKGNRESVRRDPKTRRKCSYQPLQASHKFWLIFIISIIWGLRSF